MLCNRGVIVNSYKLQFSFSHFSFQPNKGKQKNFYPPTFPSSQPNTHDRKHKYFLLELPLFYPCNIFYHSTFLFSHPNRPLVYRQVMIRRLKTLQCLSSKRSLENTLFLLLFLFLFFF